MVILILRLKRDVRIHQGTNLIVKSDSTHAHDGMMIAVKKELRRFGQKVENWIYIVENHISVVENFASIVENFISIVENFISIVENIFSIVENIISIVENIISIVKNIISIVENIICVWSGILFPYLRRITSTVTERVFYFFESGVIPYPRLLKNN